MTKKTKLRKPTPKYPGDPQLISTDKQAWFYTQPKSLLVVMELRQGEAWIGTISKIISWKKIINAVAVHKRVRR